MLPGFAVMLPGAAVVGAVLTAAADPGNPGNIGFYNGVPIGDDPANNYGSLTGQPLAGETCIFFNYSSDSQIACVVLGDVSALVSTLSFYFNDVEFPITYVQGYDISNGDFTYFTTGYDVTPVPFTVGVPVSVRIE